MLVAETTGSYHSDSPLANITIAGLHKEPKVVEFRHDQESLKSASPSFKYVNGTAYITGLEQYTRDGAFEHGFQLSLSN
jgi:alpha-glucosidase